MRVITSLLFSFLLSNLQTEEKIYFGRANNYSSVYSYGVTEIHISSDSILTRYDYKVPNKREWKNYKKYHVDMKVQLISKRGEYFALINPESNMENDMHYLKITEKKLTYYLREPSGGLIKGYAFKRKN